MHPALAPLLFLAPPSGGEVPFQELPNPAPFAADAFGASVAIDGRTVAVGAPGVLFSQPGSVHLYAEDPSGRWFLTESLTIESDRPFDSLGVLVDLDGDRLAAACNIGAVLHTVVFERDDVGRWQETHRLSSGDGYDVSCAPYWYLALDGQNLLLGERSDLEFGPWSGAVHAYTLNGAGVEYQKLVPHDIAALDHFGQALALDGDTAVISSFVDKPTGSVYVFEKTPGGWHEVQKITNPTSASWFGLSVAIHGDLIAVGAPDCPDSGGGGCDGIVFVFERHDGHWSEVAQILGGNPLLNEYMGEEIALDRERIYVRTRKAPNTILQGGIRVFDRTTSGSWVLTDFLASPLPQGNPGFGWSIAADGRRVVTSAIGHYKYCAQSASPGQAMVLKLPFPGGQ